MRRPGRDAILAWAHATAMVVAAGAIPAAATPVAVRPPVLRDGDSWVQQTTSAGDLPLLDPGWERRVFWDLRPFAARAGRRVRWSVVEPARVGLGRRAHDTGADDALCAGAPGGAPAAQGCLLFRQAEVTPLGPRVVWSGVTADLGDWWPASEGPAAALRAAGSRTARTTMGAQQYHFRQIVR